MELINQLKSLENIVEKHRDLIEKESRNLVSEFSISTAEKTQYELGEIENSNRLLQIGIVGRVKAGKSSLLNALLFDGKAVLPKAATPMTAALTVISYGDELSAEVEFFTQQDIENIKNDASQYEAEFKRLLTHKKEEARKRIKKKEDKFNNTESSGGVIERVKSAAQKGLRFIPLSSEQETKLEKQVARDLGKSEPSLSASHDQYQRIKESGIAPESLENS